MPTASGVSERFQQQLCKGEATYITSRQKAPYFRPKVFLWRYVIEVCAAFIPKPWDTIYCLNNEKYELAIEMKHLEKNLHNIEHMVMFPQIVGSRLSDIFQPHKL